MSEKKEPKKVEKREKTTRAILVLIAIVVLIVIGIVLIVSSARKNEGEEDIESVSGDLTETDENVSIAEDGTKVNVSSKIKEEKEIDGLKITDMEITEVDNVSTIVANVKNDTGEEKGEFAIEIKLIDREGNEITTVPGYIGKIRAGESMGLKASATYDFANAYDCEIIKK